MLPKNQPLFCQKKKTNKQTNKTSKKKLKERKKKRGPFFKETENGTFLNVIQYFLSKALSDDISLTFEIKKII